MTYLGHNTRGVLHRYRAQNRSIESWFERYQDVIKMACSDGDLTSAQAARTAEAVMSFESLMMTELVDWLAISTADGMDLGLS